MTDNSHEDTPSWAKKLESLRTHRGGFSDPELSQEQRLQIQRQYLQHWKKEHNDALSSAQNSASAQILLVDEWFEESQHILAHEEVCQDGIVQLRLPEKQTAENPVSENNERLPETTDFFQNNESESTSDCSRTVVATVVKPICHEQKPVAIIDEAVLSQHLCDKLRPHLHDAIAGIVKTEVRKKIHQLTLQLEEELALYIPDIIEETLKHHVQQTIKEMKNNP